MKATMHIPDEMYREIKAKSALEGRSVTVMLYASWLRGLVPEPDSVPVFTAAKPCDGKSRICLALASDGVSCAKTPTARTTCRRYAKA